MADIELSIKQGKKGSPITRLSNNQLPRRPTYIKKERRQYGKDKELIVKNIEFLPVKRYIR